MVRCLLAMLLSTSCLTASSAVNPTQNVDAGDPTELERQHLRSQVAALANQVEGLLYERDEALWRHWTIGTPLEPVDAGFPDSALELVRRAASMGADEPRALKHLEQFLENEARSARTAAERQARATLENTLTFSFDGKSVRLRDLTRLLAAEKSALKRKALWNASLTVSQQLDGGVDDSFAEACALRELDLAATRERATRVLQRTAEPWGRHLQRLNDAETRLPMASLSRADLPRLLHVAPEIDGLFPRATLATNAVETLGTLGLYGTPGLTLDLSEANKKNPLPLTVKPRNGVRLSYRPLGGLRDQELLLSELGVAVALQHTRTGRVEYDRLGDTSFAQLNGALFASLAAEPTWLEARGVPTVLQPAVIQAVEVHRLFLQRRAAATFLARADNLDRANTAALFTRALGVLHTEADVSALHLDGDSAVRSATMLRALELSARVRATLPEDWFRRPELLGGLRGTWSRGSSVAAEASVGDAGDAGH